MDRPVMRYHSGKFRLAPWILEFFPPHQIYVESFGGAAGVLIENRDALDSMRDHDTPDTLHYVDPPYVLGPRSTGGNRYYRHEMTDADHQTLLAGILDLTGMVVVSGYAHPIYDEMLASWETHSTSSRISAGRGTATRTETVWLNPACSRALHAQGLFEECTT